MQYIFNVTVQDLNVIYDRVSRTRYTHGVRKGPVCKWGYNSHSRGTAYVPSFTLNFTSVIHIYLPVAERTRRRGDSAKRNENEKKKRWKEKKYLLVFPACQDQSNERPVGSEIDETNCYGFCINNNNKMEYIYLYDVTTVFIWGFIRRTNVELLFLAIKWHGNNKKPFFSYSREKLKRFPVSWFYEYLTRNFRTL